VHHRHCALALKMTRMETGNCGLSESRTFRRHVSRTICRGTRVRTRGLVASGNLAQTPKRFAGLTERMIRQRLSGLPHYLQVQAASSSHLLIILWPFSYECCGNFIFRRIMSKNTFLLIFPGHKLLYFNQ
jgi:hypothetical protein